MNQKETAKLLAVLAAAYTKFEVDETKMRVWHEMLGDMDYEVVSVAAKKCILEKTFAPSIAEIRQEVVKIMNPNRLSGAEAWGEVEYTMKKYGATASVDGTSYKDVLSPLVLRTVRYMGWRDMCMSDNINVVRGQFLKLYEQLYSQETEELLLPENIRVALQKISPPKNDRLLADPYIKKRIVHS